MTKCNFMKRVAFIIFITVLVSACTKEEVVPKTKQELVVGKWQISSFIIEYVPSNGITTKINILVAQDFQSSALCIKDDILTLKSGGDALIDFGSNACGNTSGADRWGISNDEKNIASVYLNYLTLEAFEQATSSILLQDITESMFVIYRTGIITPDASTQK